MIDELLVTAHMEPKPVYRPGEVCRLLRISPTTLLKLFELAEHPTLNQSPHALQSFRIGCHHRIAHQELADWLVRNREFQR